MCFYHIIFRLWERVPETAVRMFWSLLSVYQLCSLWLMLELKVAQLCSWSRHWDSPSYQKRKSTLPLEISLEAWRYILLLLVHCQILKPKINCFVCAILLIFNLFFFRVMKILYWKSPICSTLRKTTKSKKSFRPIWKIISELPLKGWISKMMEPERTSTVSSKNSRTRKSPISSQTVIQYSSTVFIFSYVIYYIFKSYRWTKTEWVK